VSAPTGSGKTLAFVLPIIQSLRSRIVPRVRALAVLPTQVPGNDLAKTVSNLDLDLLTLLSSSVTEAINEKLKIKN